MDINWFPGHMTKAKRQLADKLKIIDLIIEVADARAPSSTLNPDFNDIFAGKRRVIVLNKRDLADQTLTEEWKTELEKKGFKVYPFSCITDNPKKLISAINTAVDDIVNAMKERGVKKTVRAMVFGIPNVGKSALLNRLAGQKRLKEGNKPGVTKGLQWIHVTPYLELMDTPGILWPKIEDQQTAIKIAVLGSIREEILDILEIALLFIKLLKDIKPSAILDRYKVSDLDKPPLAIMEEICKKRGFILSRGEYDYDRCAKTLLDEFRAGKLGQITLERP